MGWVSRRDESRCGSHTATCLGPFQPGQQPLPAPRPPHPLPLPPYLPPSLSSVFPLPFDCQVFFHCDQLFRGMYAVYLERWLRFFPREALLVIKAEDMFRCTVGGGGLQHAA